MSVPNDKEGRAAKSSPEQEVQALEQDVQEIRADLTGLVNELDHRRHDLFDVKKQLSRHAIPLIVAGVGLVAVVAGSWALAAHRRRQRQTVGSRAARLRQAVARMIDKPERVARSPSMAEKIVGAGAAAVISVLAKRLAERTIRGSR